MFKVIVFLLASCLALSFSGCAGSGAAEQKRSAADEAAEAAAAALAALDNGGVYPSGSPAAGPGLSSQAAAAQVENPGSFPEAAQVPQLQPQSARDAGGKPAWVDAPDSVYSKQRYVAAVGFGSDRRQAERNALANLTGVFGQSIQAEMKTVNSYSEAVRTGAIQAAENNTVQNAITTSAAMDSLVGAEIADVWFDSRSTYYAAAVMEKAKTSVLYADLIRSNERIIADLLDMSADERNTLNGYSRCLLSATIADADRVYANVLTYVGNTSGINPGEMKKGEEYRLQAAEIARNIPIAVRVNGDRSDRIKAAFSGALSRLGFRSGGGSSRYVLEAQLTLTPAELPNQQNRFVRYLVDAELKDSAGEYAVLLPYSASGREGHLNQPEAEERAVRAAERKISDEFGASLQDYLSTLLPGKK
ncbi:MAG: LPP20 family lipoprotein [Treponema sp.]|jgi:hypothetical protein|nr:LPP20 family lipoprotein [Treponema sp.]